MPHMVSVADKVDRPLLLVISASASSTSRSERLGDFAADQVKGDRMRVEHLRLRTLPPGPLIHANVADPEVARAVELLDQAQGVIVVTPTYKGTYSGLLKIFLDILPQYALRGKVVLPMATGGTVAHMLMLDYSLRPILQTMWPKHVAQGCFVSDSHLRISETDQVEIEEPTFSLMCDIFNAFHAELYR